MEKQRENDGVQEERQLVDQWEGGGTLPELEESIALEDPDATWRMIR